MPSRFIPTSDQQIPLILADSLFLRGDLEGARQELEKTFARSPALPVAHLYNRGLLERLLDRGSGREWFQRAYVEEPEEPLNAWGLGVALMDEGELESAEEVLRQAVYKGDHFYEAATELGRNLRLQGKVSESIHALRKYAFGSDRVYDRAHCELALSLLQRGGESDQASALETLLAGYEEFPYECVLYQLMELRRQRLETAHAIALGEEYLRLYPKGPHRLEVLTRLQSLNPDSLYVLDGHYHFRGLPGRHDGTLRERALPQGKHFTYEVGWKFITLGTLELDVLKDKHEGEDAWLVRYIMRSAPALPFVSIADTFYASLDHQLRYTHRLDMHYNEAEFTGQKSFVNDYDAGVHRSRVRHTSGYWFYEEKPLPPDVYDASSQIWYARQLVLSRSGGTATVEISRSFERTVIENEGVEPNREIEIEGRKRKLVRLEGIMPYRGIAGLTGEYKGWYTAGEDAYPVEALFKIFLGSIRIRFLSVEESELSPEDLFF